MNTKALSILQHHNIVHQCRDKKQKNKTKQKIQKIINRHLSLSLCVCVCVCVCERERERERGWQLQPKRGKKERRNAIPFFSTLLTLVPPCTEGEGKGNVCVCDLSKRSVALLFYLHTYTYIQKNKQQKYYKVSQLVMHRGKGNGGYVR